MKDRSSSNLLLENRTCTSCIKIASHGAFVSMVQPAGTTCNSSQTTLTQTAARFYETDHKSTVPPSDWSAESGIMGIKACDSIN